MKKILTTILIMIMILCTSSVFGYIGIEKVYDNNCTDFREQIYQNYYYRNNNYNTNSTHSSWKKSSYIDEETTILNTNGDLYYYFKYDKYLCFNTTGKTEKLFYCTNYKGTYSTNPGDIDKNTILYSPLTFFENSEGYEIKYKKGSIDIPAMHITSQNDGGLVIYYPQNDEIKNTKKLLHLIVRNYKDNIFVKSIDLDLYNNTYEDNLTDNRFWTFTGKEVNNFLELKEGYYYLQLIYTIAEDEQNINSNIVSVTPYFCLSENGIENGNTGGDTGDSGETGDSGTETPGGDTGDNENKNNDYITNEPVYDENGELAEEQTGLVGSILKGFKWLIDKILSLLFEIDEEYIGKLINNLSEDMQNNQSILTIPMYLLTKTMDTFISYTPKDFVLSWENVEFQGITLIEQGSLNLNKLVEQNEVFKKIYDIMIIVETFGMIILFANWLRNLFFDLLGIDWTGFKADENEMTITNVIDMDTGENYTTYTGEDINGNKYKIKSNHTKEKKHRPMGFGN